MNPTLPSTAPQGTGAACGVQTWRPRPPISQLGLPWQKAFPPASRRWYNHSIRGCIAIPTRLVVLLISCRHSPSSLCSAVASARPTTHILVWTVPPLSSHYPMRSMRFAVVLLLCAVAALPPPLAVQAQARNPRIRYPTPELAPPPPPHRHHSIRRGAFGPPFDSLHSYTIERAGPSFIRA